MQTQRVLIVEDEMLLATVLEETVAIAGYTVVGPVGRLARAIGMARTAEIDVALLDVNLYGEPVYPVAQVLWERGIPFAFLTGCDCESVPTAFQRWTVLTKPFKVGVVLDVLRELVASADTIG